MSIGLSDAMHQPDAPPPDPEREYMQACQIIEATAGAWRHGAGRTDLKRLKLFVAATDYIIQANTNRINGE